MKNKKSQDTLCLSNNFKHYYYITKETESEQGERAFKRIAKS